MSLATLSPTPDDFDDLEFAAIVADFDEPTPTRRPSRAAQRREARQQIDRQLGIRRHRTGEREQ
jgi:hypothetical protein